MNPYSKYGSTYNFLVAGDQTIFVHAASYMATCSHLTFNGFLFPFQGPYNFILHDWKGDDSLINCLLHHFPSIIRCSISSTVMQRCATLLSILWQNAWQA